MHIYKHIYICVSHSSMAILVAKMSSNASMSQPSLLDSASLKPSTYGNISIKAECMDMFAKPFLVAAKHYTHSWHPNAFPCPGVASMILCDKGAFFIKLVTVSDLRKMGMSSLISLDLAIKGIPDLKVFDAVHKYDMVLNPGDAVYVPAGFIPFVIAMEGPNPKDDRKTSVAIVSLLFDLDKARCVASDDFNEVASNISSSLVKCKGSPTWDFAKPFLENWIKLVQKAD